jgi:hypothetical protein
MRVGGQLHAPAALPPGKRPGTHCIGGWWAPGPVWTATENLDPTRIRPRTVQPVASRSTNYAIPAYARVIVSSKVFKVVFVRLSVME